MRHPEREVARAEQTTGQGSDAREECRGRERSYRLDESELETLRIVGAFRSVNLKDLGERQASRLIACGLIDRNTVYPKRDGRPLDVLSLSSEGKQVIENVQALDDKQRYYSGFVKLREASHDVEIYPAYVKALEDIECAAGHVDRIVLEAELKASINSRMNKDGFVSGEPWDNLRREIARELDLEIVDGKLPRPDLRIEYTDERGEQQHRDIEIVTRHYHGRSMGQKAQAGFRMVRAGGSGSGAAVPDYRRKGF